MGIGLIDEIPYLKIQNALTTSHHSHYPTLKALLSAIGEGALDASDVIHSLYPKQQLSSISRGSEHIELKIAVQDREGMVADILQVLSQFRVNIIDLNAHAKSLLAKHGEVRIILNLDRYDTLQSIFTQLEQIDGVYSVSRVFRAQQIGFTMFAFITVCFWLLHPIYIEHFTRSSNNAVVYIGLLLLLVLFFYLIRYIPRYVSRFQERRPMLIATGFITLFVISTLVWEIITYDITANWGVVTIILVAVSYLGLEYWNYRKKKLY